MFLALYFLHLRKENSLLQRKINKANAKRYSEFLTDLKSQRYNASVQIVSKVVFKRIKSIKTGQFESKPLTQLIGSSNVNLLDNLGGNDFQMNILHSLRRDKVQSKSWNSYKN